MRSSGGMQAAVRRSPIAVAAFLTFLTAARFSVGAQPGYEISLGAAESDNVARAPTDRQSDTILTEGVGLTWHELRPRLNADIDADLNYLEYLNHTVRNEVIGNFLGQARFALAPEILFWHASDNFGQGLVDPLAADNPANRENINYLSTGPELMLPLGATTLLDVKADYGKVTYQVSPLNNQRADGSIGVVRRLSPYSSVSVNFRDERVDYSNDVQNPDYSRQDAFLHYEMNNKRNVIDIDLGYSKLRDSIAPASGVLARFDVSHRISPSSTVALSLGHQYSDAGESFRLGQTLGGVGLNTQTVTQTGAPFTSDYASLAWNFLHGRTGFQLSADYFKDTYQQPSTLDDNRTQVSARLSRELTPTLQVSVTEQYFRQQFKDVLGNSNQTLTDLQLQWRASQRLTLIFDASRANRRSDAPDTDFAEDRFWVRIAYGRRAVLPSGPPKPPLPGQLLR